MTATLYCCIISVIVIHSYKIPLFLWYLACHICVYVAIVSIKMCLSVNGINKRLGEYKIARKVDIVVGLICFISMP